jgi:hypothetical protein
VQWDLRLWRELVRSKLPKHSLAGIEPLHHPRFGRDAALVFGKEDSRVRLSLFSQGFFLTVDDEQYACGS